MPKFRVCKTLRCHRTLVYIVNAPDADTAEERVRADMGSLVPIDDTTEMDSDPDDSYSTEEVDMTSPGRALLLSEGFRVHHDIQGWYIVQPGEEEPEDGSSLGFDGRQHFAQEVDAWIAMVLP